MAVPRMAEPLPQHRAARTLEPLEAPRSRRWQSKFCRGLAAVGGTEPAPHLRCAHLSPQRPAPPALTDGPGAALLDGPVLAPRRLLLQLP